MKIAVVLDFDGTITYHDVFEKLLDEYTSENWRLYDYLVEKGQLKLEEAIKKQFELIKHAGLNKLSESASKYLETRKGFKEFAEFCEAKGIELIIASAGLDLYIEKLLKKEGIKATCFCMKVKHESELHLEIPSYDLSYVNFKQHVVEELKKKQYYVIYVGDGFNDFWAAKSANMTLAIKDSVLEERCRMEGLKYRAIEDFHEAKEILENLLSSLGV